MRIIRLTYPLLLLLFFLFSAVCVAEVNSEGENTGQSAPQPKAKITFDVWEYQVEGNHLLGSTDIENVLTPYLGIHKTIEDIDAARRSLEGYYRNKGYPTVLVSIPEQDILAGAVKLQVVEAKIDRLALKGVDFFSIERMKQKIPSAARGNVLFLPDFQQQLAALNQMSSDRSVTPVIKPGIRPGTVDLDLRVKESTPLHGAVELTNKSGSTSNPLRMSTSLGYYNLFQKEHSFSLSYQTAPENPQEVQVLTGTYVMRIPGSENVLAAYAVKTNSDVASVAGLNVLGTGNIVGVRNIIPFASSASGTHSVVLGIDRKDFNEQLVFLDDAVPVTTPLDYITFSAQYSGTLRGASQTRFSAGVNFGVRGLGDDYIDCQVKDAQGNILTQQVNEFECKRFKGRSNYLYLKSSAGRTQNLFWGFAIDFQATGQLTNGPLISNEQISAGGVDTVRAYYESQAIGDYGLISRVELQHDSVPGLFKSKWFQKIRPYVFGDGGAVFTSQPLPGEDDASGLLSAGVGLDGQILKYASFKLDYAMALRDFGNPQSSSYVGRGDWRLHFTTAFTF